MKMLQRLHTKDLTAGEYADYFQKYFDLVGEADVLELISGQQKTIHEVFKAVEEQETNRTHEPYTWTIKQVLGHVIDVEKVFGSRAHRIAFGGEESLPGFDHDKFVNEYDYSAVPLGDLLKEFEHSRIVNAMMFNRLTPEMWERKGECSGKNISVRAIACLLAGHFIHHVGIAQQRMAG